MTVLDQILTNLTFLSAAEQHAMRQNDGHDAIGTQMVQVVEQESIICPGLRSYAIAETRIDLLVSGIPILRIGWIGDHRIHEQRIVRFLLVLQRVEPRPVVLQSVAVAGNDVVGKNATHHQIHTREVVGVLLELLRVIHDGIRIAVTSSHRLTDMNQQGTGAGCRIVDLDLLAPLQMPGDDFAHQLGNLRRCVEFAGLLPRIGGEIADEIFVDEAENVIILTTIHRNVFNEVNQISRGLGLASRVGAKFGKPGLQRVENTVEHSLTRRIDVAGERRKRITHVGNLEIVALFDPCGKQVVIGDEIATLILYAFHNVRIILRKLWQVILGEIVGLQAHQLVFRKEFIENEAKNVILVFVRLDLGTHLIGGFPNLRSELLLIHLSLLIAVPANQCTAPRVTAHLP